MKTLYTISGFLFLFMFSFTSYALNCTVEVSGGNTGHEYCTFRASQTQALAIDAKNTVGYCEFGVKFYACSVYVWVNNVTVVATNGWLGDNCSLWESWTSDRFLVNEGDIVEIHVVYTLCDFCIGTSINDPKIVVTDGLWMGKTQAPLTSILPLEYNLEQNFPNPFNPTTTIKYSIPEDGFVELAVYNILGQKVTSLVNQLQTAGNYAIKFNASDLPSGVYVYRLSSKNYSTSKKLILSK